MATQKASGFAAESQEHAFSAVEADDAAQRHRYHFLDVGDLKYGECTLVEAGDKRILIDGSHKQDYRGQAGHLSVPDQLDAIFGSERPHKIDLVVVTHCHADHVGCLPDLIEHRVIEAKLALLTDPQSGFGRSESDDARLSDSMTVSDQLAALLREEDASDLEGAELEAFVDAALTVEERYANFIRGLALAGTEVTFWRGQRPSGAIANLLGQVGADLLGPSKNQLVLCAEQISSTNSDAVDATADAGADSIQEVIGLYKSLAAQDRTGGRGDAMNCQSITFAFGPSGQRVLLAGDMQFSEPNVRDADVEVAKMRERVVGAGPYKVFKTTHHTARNGQDSALLDALGNPPIIVHSGGLHDEHHPNPGTLQMLADRGEILFARTDRNGRISVDPSLDIDGAITIEKGELNDFTDNRTPDEEVEQAVIPPRIEPAIVERRHATTALAVPQVIIVNLPPGPVDISVGGVDIVTREPSGAVEHGSGGPQSSGPYGTHFSRGPGTDPTRSRFGGLLFVTDSDRLRKNIGRSEAGTALDFIASSGGELVDAPESRALDAVMRRLAQGNLKGVVILGGYDVVPPRRLDVLEPELKRRLGDDAIFADADRFVVYSDSVYGDRDGDGIAELPVSRIPDGRDAELVMTALSSKSAQPHQRFGIRNVARPFADSVWLGIPGTSALGISEPLQSRQIQPGDVGGEGHYLMLHGSYSNARQFTGEYANDRTRQPVAFEIGLVPKSFAGLTFVGCCWGALPVDRRTHDPGDPAPRLAEDSIAMAYLKAGANAFIGCTGSHYSGPSPEPGINYATLLHNEFWKSVRERGSPPAQALFEARGIYLRDLASRRLPALDAARRFKNHAQFSCLGLGW